MLNIIENSDVAKFIDSIEDEDIKNSLMKCILNICSI